MNQIKTRYSGRFLKKLLFTLMLILGTTIASIAQCPDPNNPDCGEADPGGPGVPLDGGVSLLIAGGVTYVAAKMRKQHLKRKAAEQAVEN